MSNLELDKITVYDENVIKVVVNTDDIMVVKVGGPTGIQGQKGDKGDVGPAVDTATLATTGSNYFLGSQDLKSSGAKILNIKRTGVFDSVQSWLSASSGTSTAGWNDWTNEAGLSRGTVSGDIIGLNGDSFFVGKTDQFSNISIDIGTAKSAGGTMTFQYSLGGDEWGTLDDAVDGTVALTVDGVITFTPPVGWAVDTINDIPNLYWVRIGTTGGAFSTEPTIYLAVPNDGSDVVEIYANGNDTVPSLCVDNKGGVAIGYADAGTYNLRVAGTGYYGSSLSLGSSLAVGSSMTVGTTITNAVSSTGINYIGGLLLNSSTATAVSAAMNSPVVRLSSQAWNTTPTAATKINAMDIAVVPTSGSQTSARMIVKNTTVNGNANATELVCITTSGSVGIGTSTPSDKLELSNGNLVFSKDGWSSDLSFGAAGTTNVWQATVGGTQVYQYSANYFYIPTGRFELGQSSFVTPGTDNWLLRFHGGNYKYTATSSQQITTDFLPKINQTGSAGFTAVRISPYLLTTGTGSNILLDVGTNSGVAGGGTHTSYFSVDSTGSVAMANRLNFTSNAVTASTATAGTKFAMPVSASGFLTVIISGKTFKMPLFEV
jgi:hypothetical protein